MSSQIPSTGLRIASSLVSVTAEEFTLPASEDTSASAQDGYGATPAFEKSRTLADIVRGGGGEPKKEDVPLFTPLQKGVMYVVGAAAAVTAAWLALRGTATDEKEPLSPLPDPRAVEIARTKAKIFDATHLEKYPHPLRSNIIGEWMALGDAEKVTALRREFNLREADFHPLPTVPPPTWTANVAALLEQENALKATEALQAQGAPPSDRELYQRRLTAANNWRELGEKCAMSSLYEFATRAFMNAGGFYESLGPGEVGQIFVMNAYQSAALYADLADDGETASVAERKVELIQAQARLFEQFTSFQPGLLAEGVDARGTANIVAAYIVGDPMLRDQVFEYRSVTNLPGHEYPFPTLKEGWTDVVRGVLREFGIASGATASALGEVSALRLFGAGRYSDAEVGQAFDTVLREWLAQSKSERDAITSVATLKNEAFILSKGESIPSAWLLGRMSALVSGVLAEGLDAVVARDGREKPDGSEKKENRVKQRQELNAK